MEGSSGEERTLSLPEGIAITTPSGEVPASLADIAADTLLRVSCDAQGTPTRVEILKRTFGQRGSGPAQRRGLRCLYPSGGLRNPL